MKLELRFITDIKNFYKLYSVWFFVIIGCLPDLYNQAISSGFITQDEVPKVFARLITSISFLGLASRLIQQKKASLVTDESSSTPGVAVVAPVPANVQAALDENTQTKEQTKATEITQSTSSHLN